MGQFNSSISQSVWVPWLSVNSTGTIGNVSYYRRSHVEKKLQRKRREELQKSINESLEELAKTINSSRIVSSCSDTEWWNTWLNKEPFSWYDKTESETSEGNQGDSEKD